jgi:hypothetical protein
MGSDNERLQQYSRYPKDPSQRSSRSGERKSERKRSPSPRSQKRSSRPPPRSRSREKPSGRSGRGHSPDYQYPPSNLARGDPVPSTRPRTYSMAGMTDAEIRAQWKRENEEMRAEDALNRSRHNEAEYNKRAQEARSRSRRRSDRAFSKPQHSSGEGGYSGDGRGYYTQEGRDLAPPPFSGSGYDSRVSAYPDKTSIFHTCLMLSSIRDENLRPQAAIMIPTIKYSPAIDMASVIPGSLETTGETSVLVNDPGRGPLPWPACSKVSRSTQGAPSRMDE